MQVLLYPPRSGLVQPQRTYPTPRRSLASSFFADAPLTVQENSKGGRRIGTLALTGFGVGIATPLLATTLEVAWRGWSFLDVTLIPAMLIYPWFCAAEGRHLGLRLGHPRPSIRRLRDSLRTLMVLEEQRVEQSETLFRSNDRSAKYLKMLAAKHRRAAREPWAPAAPDPPFRP